MRLLQTLTEEEYRQKLIIFATTPFRKRFWGYPAADTVIALVCYQAMSCRKTIMVFFDIFTAAI